MEDYRILQRLGKGAQGSVYLCENRLDGRKYVLKKVECNDESEANKAFKEAMALQELQHPYICGYKEFFVTWDKEESAMYVCIVMDYYKNGDLDRVLRQKRSKKEPISEIVLKKWLGQIIEALVFVHRKQVIHRDLKPSNIFMKEDLSIAIGDFGVATIMGDARTKTRTTVGSMNWMAPEVLERPYDERSDVWSAGCVTLEMTTCGFCDTAQMCGKLFEIKHNPQTLEELLEEVSKTYSADLVSLIRTMLRRNFKQRPSAEELMNLPYVKDCLALSGSELAEMKKKHKQEAASKPVPKDKGINAVVDYIHDNKANESCVQAGLESLSELTKQEGNTLDNRGKRVIIAAMKEHMDEEQIQIHGCHILNNLIVAANVNDLLYTSEVISVIPLAMKSHPSSAQLQQAAASLLMALSADESAAELIGTLGGIQDILAAMRTFPNDAALCATCCSSLWSLAVNENNARIVTEEKGLQDVVNTMNTHKNSSEVMEAASAAMLSLSMEDENVEAASTLECVGILIDTIKNHTADPKVVKNSCMALASLVEPDEESAFKVLTNKYNGEEVAGIPVIVKAYECHKDNAEVVESICTIIQELCEYEDISAEVKHLRVGQTVLNEVHKRFKDNQDIIGPCEAALGKISPEKIKK